MHTYVEFFNTCLLRNTCKACGFIYSNLFCTVSKWRELFITGIRFMRMRSHECLFSGRCMFEYLYNFICYLYGYKPFKIFRCYFSYTFLITINSVCFLPISLNTNYFFFCFVLNLFLLLTNFRIEIFSSIIVNIPLGFFSVNILYLFIIVI